MNLFTLDTLLSMFKAGWIGQGFQDWLDEAAGGAKTVGAAPGPVPFLTPQPDDKPLFSKAMGGPVSAGMAYTVGEHRREWFVPKVDGVISNKAPMTSGGGDTFNIVAPSPQTAAAEIIRQRRKQSYLAGVA